MNDPKLAARERFAEADWGERGLDLVERCATDPPLVIGGLLDAIEERAPDSATVIELGFGGGWLLERLVEQPHRWRLAALDLSHGFTQSAHRRFGDRVHIVLGDMDRLPFPDAVFDVVATCWTLYFMRDIDATLAEIKRCLRPGGRLIAATNAADHEQECGEIVEEAIRLALGRDVPNHDVALRFELDNGLAYARRHFPRVEVRHWDGEMVLTDPDDVAGLWPKWEPALMSPDEQQAVRTQFLRLGREHVQRHGELRMRRRNGAFICDLQP